MSARREKVTVTHAQWLGLLLAGAVCLTLGAIGDRHLMIAYGFGVVVTMLCVKWAAILGQTRRGKRL